MSIATTQGIPRVITAGDAVTFEVNDSVHPASIWTASTIYFKDETGAIKSFAHTSLSGDIHVFALTNANTLTLIAGTNLVCVGFSDGTNRAISDWQECLILADPTTAATPSFAAAQVALLKTVIASFNASSALTVNFNGQSFTRDNLKAYQDQLITWQAELYEEQEQAKVDRGISPIGNRVRTQFVQ